MVRCSFEWLEGCRTQSTVETKLAGDFSRNERTNCTSYSNDSQYCTLSTCTFNWPKWFRFFDSEFNFVGIRFRNASGYGTYYKIVRRKEVERVRYDSRLPLLLIRSSWMGSCSVKFMRIIHSSKQKSNDSPPARKIRSVSSLGYRILHLQPLRTRSLTENFLVIGIVI